MKYKYPELMSLRKKIAIDLFAGCGGMTYGLRRAGFDVKGALEIDPIASTTYRLNHPKTPLKEADIRDVNPIAWMKELKLHPGKLDLLAGCPPCQGFSRLRTLNGGNANKDRRNRLVMEMARFIQKMKPKSIMMENVPGLAEKQIFKDFLSFLRHQGYVPTWQVLDASDYGVPQRRRRLVLTAGKGFSIPFAGKARTQKTVRMAIGGLKRPGKSGDLLHDMPERRTPEMKAWIAAVPKNGGSRGDLPAQMQRPCHQKMDGFNDVYGRMAWNLPSPTLTSGCCNPSKGRFLHPSQNRNITMREAALLQTFPKAFNIPTGTTKTAAALMIGNGLPPEFVFRHAREVRKSLELKKRKVKRS